MANLEGDFNKEEQARVQAEREADKRRAADAKAASLTATIMKPIAEMTGAKPGSDQWHDIAGAVGLIAQYAASVDKIFVAQMIQGVLPGHPRVNEMIDTTMKTVESIQKPATPAAVAPGQSSPVVKVSAQMGNP